MPLITKTAYLQGLQCPKLLWHRCRQPEAMPEASALTEAVFDQSREVGHMAKRLFPDGIEVGAGIIDLSPMNLTQCPSDPEPVVNRKALDYRFS